jgi:hypothetical protein
VHFVFFLVFIGRGLSTALLQSSALGSQHVRFIFAVLCCLLPRWCVHSPYGLIEYTLQIPLRQRRALQVFDRSDLFRYSESLLIAHRLHLLRSQGIGGPSVVPKVELCADEDYGNVGGVVLDFWVPLGPCES